MSFYTILPLFAFSFCLILGLLVLRGHYRSLAHRLFSIFLFSMGLWGLVIFGMRASPDIAHALTWEKALMPVGTAGGIAFWGFSLTYTRTKPKKGFRAAALIILLLFIALSPTKLFVKDMGVDVYGYFPIAGPLLPLAALCPFLFLLLGLVNLSRAYRSSTSYEERNRYLYIIIGLILCVLGVSIDAISSLGVPIPPGGIIGNTLFCALATVAILKYHLLDIHIVARKGLAYLLTSTIIAIPYVGIMILFNHFFGIGGVPVWAHFILLVLLALVLQTLWHGGQRLVDRWFYRERYDFLRELESFSQETHDISDLKQLGSSLVKLISRALQTSNVHLLMLSESGDFTTVSSAGENSIQFTLESSSPLLRWLQSSNDLLYNQDLNIIPQLQAITMRERNELENTAVALFVPLKSKKDKLVGLLLLGKKLSSQPYSEEDKRLILSVTSRMAVELENARLYALETAMRQELQRQDKQKTEFLHSIAHELKTPLTAVISSSELLGTELSSVTPDQRRRLVQNINRSAWLMDKRVAELLDLARMQVGKLELNLEPTEISHITKMVASQLHSLFKYKEQSLKLEIPDSLPPVKADGEKLVQILLNLLSNANKFSPIGSNITLWAREVDDRIVVEVKDSAPVITEEEKEKLFDPYYRSGDADERQRIPGLGLGLAISKKLVELHHGKIWVESGSGKGNTFAFSLPT